MSWRATLDGSQVRRFKAALNCFHKIGSELLIEALPGKLILRSLNSSRSAFVAITFHSGFFDAHAIFESRDVKGSVLIKHALALFRTQAIQKLVLELDVKNKEQLIATVSSESGLQKEYKIPCIDSEILQATVDKDTLPTHVVASAKELHKLLSSFQANLEEVTVIALPETMHDGRTANAVQLHSYLDPSRRQADAALHTQISVNTEAVFISFQHTGDAAADVTFNLRDFRVMLAWCMAMDMDVAIRFQTPGAPLLVQPHCSHGDMDVEAQLVLATLLESQAHRAYARKAPNTGANTNLRTYFRTPGAGVTPNLPEATPAVSARPSGVNQTGRLAGNQRHGRSRFAPDSTRQPSFESPAGQPPSRDAPVPSRMNPARHQPPREESPSITVNNKQPENAPGPRAPAGEGRAEQGGNDAERAVSGTDAYFGNLQGGAGACESFEDDDMEDDGPPLLRSRYDPRAMSADDEDLNEDEDEEAIPGTPR